MLSPSLPVQLEPSPWRPRCALYSGLKRKCTSVLWRSLDSMMMSPPRPPSPPLGPPRGTNFSLRKAMHPLPPPPAAMRIVASSMNIRFQMQKQMAGLVRPANRANSRYLRLLEFLRDDGHELSQLAAVTELDHARDLGEQGVILAASYVEARLQSRAALPHDDGAARDKLSAECFYAKP